MQERLKIILGTMNFGVQVNQDDSLSMVKDFLSRGNYELDSAFVYNNGLTEEILGSILNEFKSDRISIATKVHPRITGKLDEYAVNYQVNESLRRLKTDKIDILYFHFPVANSTMETALMAVNSLYEKGTIKEFGLSNFPAWLVVDIWHICKNNGWLCPTVYQGRYNGLSRNVETELISALRHLNIRFYAYNPLAGGMLTGKHQSFEEPPQSGRFSRLKSYRERYWKKSYFGAVNVLTKACREFNIEPVEAAYRWLTSHSMLNSKFNDGLIIGASSIKQLNQNIIALEKGKLPQTIIDAFDEAWSVAKPESPEYFNFIND